MIKLQETVKRETLRVAAGTAVLTVLMVAVFLLLGFINWSVLLGAVYGCILASLNFFLMALSVQKAAESMNGVKMPSYEEKDAENADRDPDEPEDDPAAETPEIRQAKRQMQASYLGRMLLLGVCAIIGVTVPWFDSIAALLPLLFPQIVVMILNFVTTHRKGA